VTATHLLDGSASPTGAAIVLATAVVHPESRGTLTLASTNPKQAPIIDSNYLATGRDTRRMLEAVKLGRDIARHHLFAPFNAGEMIPGNAVSDDALAEVVASNLAVYGHPTSTMPTGGPTDPWAVVDSLGLVQGGLSRSSATTRCTGRCAVPRRCSSLHSTCSAGTSPQQQDGNPAAHAGFLNVQGVP
jgi:choline dehydrogenase